MTKWSRILLTLMALLDAVCLGRFLDSLSLACLCRQMPLFLTILYSVHMVFLVSLAVSAYGLAMSRKWAGSPMLKRIRPRLSRRLGRRAN